MNYFIIIPSSFKCFGSTFQWSTMVRAFSSIHTFELFSFVSFSSLWSLNHFLFVNVGKLCWLWFQRVFKYWIRETLLQGISWYFVNDITKLNFRSNFIVGFWFFGLNHRLCNSLVVIIRLYWTDFRLVIEKEIINFTLTQSILCLLIWLDWRWLEIKLSKTLWQLQFLRCVFFWSHFTHKSVDFNRIDWLLLYKLRWLNIS